MSVSDHILFPFYRVLTEFSFVSTGTALDIQIVFLFLK